MTPAVLENWLAYSPARILAMRHISLRDQFVIFNIDYIHSLLQRRLTEITDREIIAPADLFIIQQVLISFPGIIKSRFGKSQLLQLYTVIKRSGRIGYYGENRMFLDEEAAIASSILFRT